MSDVWWAMVRRPNGKVHLHELGPEPYDAELAAVRALHSIPPDWLDNPPPGEVWYLGVSPGEPHPSQVWSDQEIATARNQAETAAGVPDQRQALETLRSALAAVKDTLPPDQLTDFTNKVQRAQRAIRAVTISELRAALRNVAPSKATVHRLAP